MRAASPSSAASSATSTSPRTRCRTRSSSRRSAGRAAGTPDNPGAWIVATARNRAIDRIRREQTLARKTELLARAETLPEDENAVIPDERLELIFACCHPALGTDAQIALTLSLVGGSRRRDRARVSRPGGDDGAAARPREAEDSRRRHPAPRAARACPARAAATQCSRRSISSSTPATGRPCAASCAAKRSGSRCMLAPLMPDESEVARPARAAALAGRAARRAPRRRGARAARGPGPLALGLGRDRAGARRARARAVPAAQRAVPGAGGDRIAACRRRDRLGADRAPLQPPLDFSHLP